MPGVCRWVFLAWIKHHLVCYYYFLAIKLVWVLFKLTQTVMTVTLKNTWQENTMPGYADEFYCHNWFITLFVNMIFSCSTCVEPYPSIETVLTVPFEKKSKEKWQKPNLASNFYAGAMPMSFFVINSWSQWMFKWYLAVVLVWNYIHLLNSTYSSIWKKSKAKWQKPNLTN